MVEVARKIEIILLSSKQQNLFEFGACFYLNKSFLKFSTKQKNKSDVGYFTIRSAQIYHFENRQSVGDSFALCVKIKIPNAIKFESVHFCIFRDNFKTPQNCQSALASIC